MKGGSLFIAARVYGCAGKMRARLIDIGNGLFQLRG